MKIGIALGGGGAKGLAHIGVLKALEQEGIKCEVIAGTSIGALVGAVYAAGNLDALQGQVNSIKLTDIPLLMSPAWSKRGFFSGKNALELLNEIIGVDTIEQLSIPYAAVSTDLRTSKRVVFTKGDIRQAVRASISIPAVFTPVIVDEQVLVDGGTLEPVPVEVSRELGADFVIAVDLFGHEASHETERQQDQAAKTRLWPAGIGTALGYLHSISSKMALGDWLYSGGKDPNAKLNILDVVEGTLAVSQRELTQFRLTEHPPDVLIQPAVAHVGLLDFHRGDPVVAIGEQAAKSALPQLKEKLELAASTT